MEARPKRGLSQPVQFLKGVGPRKAADLARIGIASVEDLLLHFPRDYLDLGEQVPLARLEEGQRAVVRGRVLAGGERRLRRGLSILSLLLEDGSGRLTLVFFNQPYLRRQLRNGAELIAYGEVSRYRSALQMQSPEIEILGGEGDGSSLLERNILPLYPLTRGVSQRWLRRLVERVLGEPEFRGALGEILPPDWLRKEGWPRRDEAIACLHFPPDRGSLNAATERLKFDELFLLQLLGALRRRRQKRERGPVLGGGQRLLEPFLSRLPFELTSAQRRAIASIREDLASGGCMNRLLQGDVGSGKTVVALAALLIACEGGYQGVFMVPLEVLARQHFESWRGTLERLGLRVGLLTGGTPAKERRALLSALASGEIDLIFGTHALIQEGVEFSRLGLAVVDEQHRFGVRQRASLRQRGVPHVLVMSATPIPRSLAMTLYGDLDLTIIDELPPGRPPVVTRLSSVTKEPQVHAFLRERLTGGERAFVIFPLIDPSDRQELKAATDEFAALQSGEFADFPCALVHGRMKSSEKAEALAGFRSGETQLLAATTVIEVGVDIPEATLMLIHNPERFGLSQLHQLRGRIGRGSRKSYCILLAPEGIGQAAQRRLETFARLRDGFLLAEEDLKLRGPGEIFGLRQHGRAELARAQPPPAGRLVAGAGWGGGYLLPRHPELVAQDLRPLRELLLRVYQDRLVLAGIG